jgi:PQQ-dependent catabolism-associated beta-propeller protein
MAVSPDNKILINTSETTNMAHFIDTTSHEVVDSVLVDSRPRYAEFTPDGKQVWVSSEIGGTVSVIEVATRKVVKKIQFAIQGIRADTIQPVGVKITPDGKTAFVALGPANRVAVIDVASYEVADYLLVGQRVWQLAFTPDAKLLLSTNGESNDVSVIDVADRKVIKSIPVGELPWGVAIR